MDDQAAIQLREQVFKPELKTRNATHHLRIYLKIFFIWLFNDVSMALFSLELVGNGFPRQGSIPRNQATIVISEVYVITVWSNLNGALVWSDLKCLTIPHFCKKTYVRISLVKYTGPYLFIQIKKKTLFGKSTSLSAELIHTLDSGEPHWNFVHFKLHSNYFQVVNLKRRASERARSRTFWSAKYGWIFRNCCVIQPNIKGHLFTG